MDLQLAGKHVLITGGSRGIGFACARLFLKEGARVSITSRTQSHLDAALERLRAEGSGEFSGHVQAFRADLESAEQTARVVDEAEAIAPVDVLVNSAGAARRTPFMELTPEAWQSAGEVLHLHQRDGPAGQAHGCARCRCHRQCDRHGRQSRDAHASGGRRRQCGLDARDGRPGRRVGTERLAHQRRESSPHAD